VQAQAGVKVAESTVVKARVGEPGRIDRVGDQKRWTSEYERMKGFPAKAR
jgi:hypothetical protein